MTLLATGPQPVATTRSRSDGPERPWAAGGTGWPAAAQQLATAGSTQGVPNEVPLHVGQNPTSGPDCTRVSAIRVDCLHPETSLNDDEFGYVVVLRPDGQLWQASVDPRGDPGDPVPPHTPWNWIG